MRARGAKIGLKTNFKKTKLLKLGKSEGEEVMLISEKIDQVDGFTYLASIISRDRGCNEYV